MLFRSVVDAYEPSLKEGRGEERDETRDNKPNTESPSKKSPPSGRLLDVDARIRRDALDDDAASGAAVGVFVEDNFSLVLDVLNVQRQRPLERKDKEEDLRGTSQSSSRARRTCSRR